MGRELKVLAVEAQIGSSIDLGTSSFIFLIFLVGFHILVIEVVTVIPEGIYWFGQPREGDAAIPN